MRAKRRLIDTPLASPALTPPPPAVSLSSTPTLSGLSSVVEHCLSLTANYSPTPNSSRSNFQNTVFLTVLRARIVAHLFLSRQSCRTGTQEKKINTSHRIFVFPILSMFASDKLTNYYRSSATAQSTISLYCR